MTSTPIDKFLTQHKDVFDLAHEVEDHSSCLLSEFNKHQIKLFDLKPHQRIFLFIMTRSLKTYSSILVLCEQGYGQDVSMLVRGLLENLITCRYILVDKHNADDKAARFVGYKWVIFKRNLSEQDEKLMTMTEDQRSDFLRRKNRIHMRVEEFKKKFQIESDRGLLSWSGKTVRDMARAVNKDLLNEYETTFRLCSRFSHPSILGDQEYMIQDNKNLTFSPLPSPLGIIPNMRSAVKYAIEFQKIIIELFDFPFKHQIKTLTAKHQSVFQAIKSPDDSSPPKTLDKNTLLRESIIVFETDPPQN